MDLTIAESKVIAANANVLGEKFGRFPRDCVEKHFTNADLAGTDRTSRQARFAMRNPGCRLAACPSDDLPCAYRRDIECSVVIDE